MILDFINILLLNATTPIDSATTQMIIDIVRNASIETPADASDTIFKVIISTVLGAGGLWTLINFIIKKRTERKEKEVVARLERKKTEQEHSNELESEMFKFDKEKYMDSQDANQSFQKTIINEIFGKFVEQSQWITNLHDKSIESLVTQMTDVNRLTKDIYVQNDVLSNRIRNLEDRFIKNSNILVTKVDILSKILMEQSSTLAIHIADTNGQH